VGFGTFITLAILPSYAAIVFLEPPKPLCARVNVAAGEAETGVELVVETPRLAIGFQLEDGQRTNDMVVFDKVTYEKLGTMGFSDFGGTELSARIFPKDRAAQDGVVHLPVDFVGHEGAGYGAEAKYAVMRYAFEVAGATGVEAIIKNENAASLALHEKLGFRVIRVDDRRTYLGITKKRFEKIKKDFGKEEEKDFLPRRR